MVSRGRGSGINIIDFQSPEILLFLHYKCHYAPHGIYTEALHIMFFLLKMIYATALSVAHIQSLTVVGFACLGRV